MEVSILRANEQKRAEFWVHPTEPLRWNASARGLEIFGRQFAAEVPPASLPAAAASLWTASETADDFNVAVTNFSRVSLCLGGALPGVCLLHSCVVYRPGEGGALFFGHSGAGKSTVGTLALEAGRKVLSDDLNTVEVVEGGGVRAQGFPWAGLYGARTWDDVRSERIRGVFRLEQASRHEVRPLAPARALAGLASCSPFVNSDSGFYEKLLANLERLLSTVPAFTLGFQKDPGLFSVVDEVLR